MKIKHPTSVLKSTIILAVCFYCSVCFYKNHASYWLCSCVKQRVNSVQVRPNECSFCLLGKILTVSLLRATELLPFVLHHLSLSLYSFFWQHENSNAQVICKTHQHQAIKPSKIGPIICSLDGGHGAFVQFQITRSYKNTKHALYHKIREIFVKNHWWLELL